jgi:hypothetical protein
MCCVIAVHRAVGVLDGGDAVEVAFTSLCQVVFRPAATIGLELSRSNVLAMYNDGAADLPVPRPVGVSMNDGIVCRFARR